MISKGPKTKSGKGCFLRTKKGLWVDFHRIGGTHKSYKTAEFGPTTPSHLREITIFRFWNFVRKLIFCEMYSCYVTKNSFRRTFSIVVGTKAWIG